MQTYTLQLGNTTRELPIVQTSANKSIPLVEFLGDVGLTRAAAEELHANMPKDTQTIFTCETSSIPLVHVLSELSGVDYEVARKRRRPYMSNPIIQDVGSMTLGVGETLWLDERLAANMRGQNVTIVLDVVASGGTMDALVKIVLRAGGKVCAKLAVFGQGDNVDASTKTLHMLPVFQVEK